MLLVNNANCTVVSGSEHPGMGQSEAPLRKPHSAVDIQEEPPFLMFWEVAAGLGFGAGDRAQCLLALLHPQARGIFSKCLQLWHHHSIYHAEIFLTPLNSLLLHFSPFLSPAPDLAPVTVDLPFPGCHLH